MATTEETSVLAPVLTPSGKFCKYCGKPTFIIPVPLNLYDENTGEKIINRQEECLNVTSCEIACRNNGGHFYKRSFFGCARLPRCTRCDFDSSQQFSSWSF